MYLQLKEKNERAASVTCMICELCIDALAKQNRNLLLLYIAEISVTGKLVTLLWIQFTVEDLLDE